MFNRDIKREFRRLDANPTAEFKARLRALILPGRAVRPVSRPLRAFALSGAAFALLFAAVTVLSPLNADQALAQAIDRTFRFSQTGYHHLKIRSGTWNSSDADGLATAVMETWTDGQRAIFDMDARENFGARVSKFFDADISTSCAFDVVIGEETCDASLAAAALSKLTNELPDGTAALPLLSLRVEPVAGADRTHSLTWITARPLGVTFLAMSDGPYGYEMRSQDLTEMGQNDDGTSGPRNAPGAESWKNTDGTITTRVTLSPHDVDNPEPAFLFQIKEISMNDFGSSDGFAGTPIAQSSVYRIDTDAMTISAVTDAWLEASRETFDGAYIDAAVSTETIKRAYESAFMHALAIGEKLESYVLESRERKDADGHALEYTTYALGENGPKIDTITATRAEFIRDTASNLVRSAKFFTEDGRLLSSVELLDFEELSAAPEGLLTLEAWKAHAATLN